MYARCIPIRKVAVITEQLCDTAVTFTQVIRAAALLDKVFCLLGALVRLDKWFIYFRTFAMEKFAEMNRSAGEHHSDAPP